MSEPIAELLTVTPHDLAHGGEAVARVDGKTVFVAGLMPGEQGTVRIVKDKGSWARAQLVAVTTRQARR
ncbi:MAG: TRAM domain-containing protein, partial [Acidimicrobiia bacterium]|nr:TRAM domain-containing protein [Acidimicrobiia bacterium]